MVAVKPRAQDVRILSPSESFPPLSHCGDILGRQMLVVKHDKCPHLCVNTT